MEGVRQLVSAALQAVFTDVRPSLGEAALNTVYLVAAEGGKRNEWIVRVDDAGQRSWELFAPADYVSQGELNIVESHLTDIATQTEENFVSVYTELAYLRTNKLSVVVLHQTTLPDPYDEAVRFNTIYLIRDAQPESGNSYLEYILQASYDEEGAEIPSSRRWELIGSTKTDLTDYVTKEQLAAHVEDNESHFIDGVVKDEAGHIYIDLRGVHGDGHAKVGGTEGQGDSKPLAYVSEVKEVENQIGTLEAKVEKSIAATDSLSTGLWKDAAGHVFVDARPALSEEDGHVVVGITSPQSGKELAYVSDVDKAKQESADALAAAVEEIEGKIGDVSQKKSSVNYVSGVTSMPCYEARRVIVDLADVPFVGGKYNVVFAPVERENIPEGALDFIENSIIVKATSPSVVADEVTVAVTLQEEVVSDTPVTFDVTVCKGDYLNIGLAYIDADKEFAKTQLVEYMPISAEE